MKKILLLLSAFIGLNAFATTGDLFNLNIDELNGEFQELALLEEAVAGNPALTFNNAVSQNLVGSNFHLADPEKAVDPYIFQFEGFLWGFLCCPVGFFVVAVNKNKTKDVKLSYWWGVFAYATLSVVVQVSAIVSAVNSTPSTY